MPSPAGLPLGVADSRSGGTACRPDGTADNLVLLGHIPAAVGRHALHTPARLAASKVITLGTPSRPHHDNYSTRHRLNPLRNPYIPVGSPPNTPQVDDLRRTGVISAKGQLLSSLAYPGLTPSFFHRPPGGRGPRDADSDDEGRAYGEGCSDGGSEGSFPASSRGQLRGRRGHASAGGAGSPGGSVMGQGAGKGQREGSPEQVGCHAARVDGKGHERWRCGLVGWGLGMWRLIGE